MRQGVGRPQRPGVRHRRHRTVRAHRGRTERPLQLPLRDGYAWGPDGATTDVPGFPATVEVRIVTNETTAANLLLSGEVNAAADRGPDVERLEARATSARDTQAIVGEQWYNQMADRRPPTPAVRQALTRALDLDQMRRCRRAVSGPGRRRSRRSQPNGVPGRHRGRHPVAGADSTRPGGCSTTPAGSRAPTASARRTASRCRSAPSYDTVERRGRRDGARHGAWEQLGVDVDRKASTPPSSTRSLRHGRLGHRPRPAQPRRAEPRRALPLRPGSRRRRRQLLGISNAEYDRGVAEASAMHRHRRLCQLGRGREGAVRGQMTSCRSPTTTVPTFGTQRRVRRPAASA